MKAQKKQKFRLSGWVQLGVWADIEAKDEKEAQKIFDKTHGSGLPDAFNWEEGCWCSSVTLDMITPLDENGNEIKTEA